MTAMNISQQQFFIFLRDYLDLNKDFENITHFIGHSLVLISSFKYVKALSTIANATKTYFLAITRYLSSFKL